MGTSLLLTIILFAAALFLLLQQPKDPLRIVVVAAASIQLLLSLGILHLSLRGIPIREVLAAVFAVVGGIIFFRTSAKHQVAASTCVTLIGALVLLTALHLGR